MWVNMGKLKPGSFQRPKRKRGRRDNSAEIALWNNRRKSFSISTGEPFTGGLVHQEVIINEFPCCPVDPPLKTKLEQLYDIHQGPPVAPISIGIDFASSEDKTIVIDSLSVAMAKLLRDKEI